MMMCEEESIGKDISSAGTILETMCISICFTTFMLVEQQASL